MIDLHTHSYFSDGSFSPSELIKKAASRGVTALALTDHDTLEGLALGQEAARREGILFIRGVELSLAFSGGEFHLLGLGLSSAGSGLEKLEKSLENLRNSRDIRNKKIIEKMRNHGIPVEYHEIEELAGSSDSGSNLVVGRPHFARFLVNRGISRTISDAFQHYLRKGQPFYESKTILTLEEAADLIAGAGGLAVVAHPLSLQMNWENLEKAFASWKEKGVRGVEAVHPSANRSKSKKLELLAEKYGLLVTAGSDFHGTNMPRRRLGRTGWGARIPEKYSDVLNHLNSNL